MVILEERKIPDYARHSVVICSLFLVFGDTDAPKDYWPVILPSSLNCLVFPHGYIQVKHFGPEYHKGNAEFSVLHSRRH